MVVVGRDMGCCRKLLPQSQHQHFPAANRGRTGPPDHPLDLLHHDRDIRPIPLFPFYVPVLAGTILLDAVPRRYRRKMPFTERDSQRLLRILSYSLRYRLDPYHCADPHRKEAANEPAKEDHGGMLNRFMCLVGHPLSGRAVYDMLIAQQRFHRHHL